VFLVAAWQTFAVQLENWRLPYYLAAYDLGELRESPSGMFWDDFSAVGSFAPGLWPDSTRYGSNHWALEPALTGQAGNYKHVDDSKWFYRVDVLSDMRYRDLTARVTLDVDSRYQGDSAYIWKKDRGAAGRIEEAHLQYDWKYGMVRLGRLKRNWGPFADRSLVLSNNPHSYDAFEWQVFSKVFEFRHLFAAFPHQTSRVDSDTGGAANRYFAAHALNIMIGSWVTLGIFESELFVRPSGFPDLQYVNPFSIYTVTNTNGEGKGNLMLGFQWHLHPFTKRVALRGQVVLDDFQVDNEGPGDKEPTHWGGDFAVHWYDPIPVGLRSALELQYRYLSRWLYTANDPCADNAERYTYLDRSLGVEDNDGDETHLAMSVVGDDYWMATAGLRYVRKGENGPTSRWGGLLGYRRETPLSERDTLWQTVDFYIDGRAYYRDFADLQVRFSNQWVKNKHNIASKGFSYEPEISVVLSVHYCDLFVPLPE
jgi:hypothetical protein